MKKAQAAMEFLMTYGWAILVVLVAIGALAYFGVLNPSRFLPESCTIGPGISCDDFRVVNDGSATIILRNGMGVELDQVSLAIVDEVIGSVAGICDGAAATVCDDWGEGEQMTVTWAAASLTSGNAGSKYAADLEFDYQTTGGIAHSKSGRLTTKYE